MRVCHRIEARVHARRVGELGWWSPLLGRVQPDHAIAVRGSWPLQRHVVGNLIAGLHRAEPAVLRGPAALLEDVLEETLMCRAGLARDMVCVGFIHAFEWQELAIAAAAVSEARLQLECVDSLVGVELAVAGARWTFGMDVPHPDVEVEVVAGATGVRLDALDGRTSPPTRRRARLQNGRLHADDADHDDRDEALCDDRR